MKEFIRTSWMGILFCLAVAVPCYFLGQLVPVIGGPVFAIIAGILLGLLLKRNDTIARTLAPGVKFTAKKVLQYAVILLGFGMNLEVVLQTGTQSLPIILCTITVSLLLAFILQRVLKMPGKIATLIGVGSSICGGSAIAATAPVIDADEDEVAQSISVIFLFNILAALIFPWLGTALGFSTTTGDAFGVFAGTAVNDTSSVTAAASTWDSMYNLGSQTLDKAVTVKLTRTLAIIPITLGLAFFRTRKTKQQGGEKIPFKKIFPFFILFFIAASVITTIAVACGVPANFFTPAKTLSKFLIVMAMAAIGFNTDVVKLIKSGAKPILLGFCCWAGITGTTLGLQSLLHIW
ncbi:MAG: YeiH family protein [Oscillospiraceae bacterium]|nr:YeiH family protein [Oscillospiraceae bacterium]